MDWKGILDIIGNIASIITVIGGAYGLCKWISTRKAQIQATKYEHSDQGLYILFVYNNGPVDAYNVKITTASFKHPIQTAAYIPKLEQGEEGQLGFSYRGNTSSLPVTIHWTDKIGHHKKRITITPSMRVR